MLHFVWMPELCGGYIKQVRTLKAPKRVCIHWTPDSSSGRRKKGVNSKLLEVLQRIQQQKQVSFTSSYLNVSFVLQAGGVRGSSVADLIS